MKKLYEDVEYDCDDAFSAQDLSGEVFISYPSEVFNNKIIFGSSFSQELPDTEVFPRDVVDVTLVRCALDNVLVPSGVTLVHTVSERRFKVQNDLNDWIVDENNNPIEPIDAFIFKKFGKKIPKPEVIPLTKVDKKIDLLETAEPEVVE